MSTRLTSTFWRNDALEAAAVVVERYAGGPGKSSLDDAIAADIRALKTPANGEKAIFLGDNVFGFDRAFIHTVKTHENAPYIVAHHVDQTIRAMEQQWKASDANFVQVGVTYSAFPRNEFESQIVREAHAKLIEERTARG